MTYSLLPLCITKVEKEIKFSKRRDALGRSTRIVGATLHLTDNEREHCFLPVMRGLYLLPFIENPNLNEHGVCEIRARQKSDVMGLFQYLR